MILDLHTHHSLPDTQAIADLGDLPLLPGQLYSAGVHPWRVPADPEALEQLLAELAERAVSAQVVAIGEAGLDALRGGPMWLQLDAFKRQARLAEELGLPLIIHDVKCHESILAVHKELRPHTPWIIHGFRAKPSVAQMFLRVGICLSFGENFNPASLQLTPPSLLFAETDESPLPIASIIERLSAAAGRDLLPDVEANMSRLLAANTENNKKTDK